jgi:hypothetical protein
VYRRVVTLAIAIAGCYAPVAPDCKLACTTDSDCISGQVCSSDHLCAGGDITSCANRTVSDGGTLADSGPPPIALHVMITGGGSVSVSVGAECTSGTCTYDVAPNTAVTLTAVDHGNNVFQTWGMACMGQDRTCQLTVTAPVKAAANFTHAD